MISCIGKFRNFFFARNISADSPIVQGFPFYCFNFLFLLLLYFDATLRAIARLLFKNLIWIFIAGQFNKPFNCLQRIQIIRFFVNLTWKNISNSIKDINLYHNRLFMENRTFFLHPFLFYFFVVVVVFIQKNWFAIDKKSNSVEWAKTALEIFEKWHQISRVRIGKWIIYKTHLSQSWFSYINYVLFI
jgi:hypothetical protein